ncbi:MAG: extracellular solute-binding protein [Deltaproteobacteria bacterium]|nr:extracellular solute-binding protein [Deltaproteobacteria bacterium]
MKIVNAAALMLLVTAGAAWGQTAKPATLAEVARYTGADRGRILAEGAKREGKLVWYTSLTAYKEIVDVFEARHPGVKVETYRASSAGLMKRTLTEAQARRHVVDVFETTPPPLMLFRDQQLLMPYTTPSIASYPEDSKEDAPKGLFYWVTDRESFVGVGYNKNSVPAKDAPKDFGDLLKPQWKGKLAFSGTDTGERIVGAMLKARGEEYIRKLKGHDAKLHMISGGALNELVVAGEVAISPTIFRNHVLMAAEKGAPVGWVPMELVLSNAGGSAIAAHAPHPHAAMLFVDFILSPEGQKIFEEVFKYGTPLKDYGFKRWYPEKGLTTAQYEQLSDKWRKLLREIGRK